MAKTTQNTEQAILDAAKREFMAKGYDGARTTAIAEAAGVTHAMLHYYFRTKENIFERILDNEMKLMMQSVLAIFGDPALPLEERLRACISCHFDFMMKNPELPRFVINEVSIHPERYESVRRHISATLEQLVSNTQLEVDREAAEGRFEQTDIRMIMLDIMSLNIFPLLAYPIIAPLLGELTRDRERFFEMRKAETTELVMRRVKKTTE